jgi:hypothetical protein
MQCYLPVRIAACLFSFSLAFGLAVSKDADAQESGWKTPSKMRAVLFSQPRNSPFTSDPSVTGSVIHESLSQLDLSRLDSELNQVARAGFNTILFWVNWGDIMHSINYVDVPTTPNTWGQSKLQAVFDSALPPSSRRYYEEKLLSVVRAAAGKGLSVVIIPFTGTVPALYTDAGENPSRRVCSWWYGPYFNPDPSHPCPQPKPAVTTYALFADNNLYAMYYTFLRRINDLLVAEPNVLGFIIPWETGNAAQSATPDQIATLADALKESPGGTPSRRWKVAYYPSPIESDPNKYYIRSTDWIALGWYGSGNSDYGILQQHIDRSISKSERVRPTTSPKLGVFLYEYGFADESGCQNFNQLTGGCVTHLSVDPATLVSPSEGRKNQANFINSTIPILERDDRVVGHSYFMLADHPVMSEANFGLLDSNGQPKPGWIAAAVSLQQPVVLGAGSVANGQFVWIQGTRFHGDSAYLGDTQNGGCIVDILDINFNLRKRVSNEPCSDTLATVTIEASLWNASQNQLYVVVVNKFSKHTYPILVKR